jgi:predicted ribosomally synthesized peptide with SipW-like signal peptide
LKRLLAILMAVALSVGAVGSSLAYFTDVETSTGNTFVAGTLDVKIRVDGGDYGDDAGPEWGLTNLGAGSNLHSRSWEFKNMGSLPINHMEMTCSFSVIEDSPNLDPDPDPNTPAHPELMARFFTITDLTVRRYQGNDVDILSYLVDTNGNGVPDLEDLRQAGIDNVMVVPDPLGVGFTVVEMTLEFSPLAGNDVQGDTLVVDFVFTFNQHSSD